MKKEIILIGGGGHCKSCIDVIELGGEFAIKGILDFPDKIGQSILGYPIIGSDDEIIRLCKEDYAFLITLGQIFSPKRRIEIFSLLKENNAMIPTVISPTAYISKHSKAGEGTIIMHHAIVNANAEIGNNCIINTKSLIEHDAIIEDHCHISTGVIINGNVIIGKETFFGSNATSKENSIIPSHSFIKANTVAK